MCLSDEDWTRNVVEQWELLIIPSSATRGHRASAAAQSASLTCSTCHSWGRHLDMTRLTVTSLNCHSCHPGSQGFHQSKKLETFWHYYLLLLMEVFTLYGRRHPGTGGTGNNGCQYFTGDAEEFSAPAILWKYLLYFIIAQDFIISQIMCNLII